MSSVRPRLQNRRSVRPVSQYDGALFTLFKTVTLQHGHGRSLLPSHHLTQIITETAHRDDRVLGIWYREASQVVGGAYTISPVDKYDTTQHIATATIDSATTIILLPHLLARVNNIVSICLSDAELGLTGTTVFFDNNSPVLLDHCRTVITLGNQYVKHE